MVAFAASLPSFAWMIRYTVVLVSFSVLAISPRLHPAAWSFNTLRWSHGTRVLPHDRHPLRLLYSFATGGNQNQLLRLQAGSLSVLQRTHGYPAPYRKTEARSDAGSTPRRRTP